MSVGSPHKLLKPALSDWLIGKGEMADAIRAFDWSLTPLGPRDKWPSALRIMVNAMIALPFASAIAWGEELILLYNDSFRIISADRHPDALGKSVFVVWPEFRHIGKPIFEKVMVRQESLLLDETPFPIQRRDRGIGEAWFTTSYSPLYTEAGQVGGTQVSLIEAAERMRANEGNLRLAAIIESSDDAIISEDLNGIIMSWNAGAERLFGYKATEVIGKPISILTPPDQHSELSPLIAKVASGESVAHYETVRITKDGRKLNISLSLSPIKDRHERVVGISKIARDITERMRIEEQLRKTTERLSLATLAAKAGIWDWNITADQLEWDDRMYQLYGLRREDFTGAYEAWESGVHPEDLPKAREELQKALRGEMDFNTEFRVLWSDGSVHHIQAASIVKRDETGHPVRMIGTNLDVTEFRQAEHQAQRLASEVQARAGELQAILDSAPVAIWLAHDPQCRRITGNTYANQLIMNVEPGANISVSAPDEAAIIYKVFLRGVELKAEQLPAQVAARTGKPFAHEEMELRFEDGRRIPVLLGAVPLFDAEGRVRGSVTIGVNISKLKTTEDDLRAAVELRDEFISIASHELKTPLTALHMQLQLLNRIVVKETVDERTNKLSKGAITSAQSLAGLLDELLDVTRIRAGKLKLEPQEMDLRATVLKNVALVEEQIKQRGSSIAIHAHQPIHGKWDPMRIEQVVSNLFSNAIKYGEGKPVEVTLTADQDAGTARLLVKDHGIGIESEMQTKIFNRFQRAITGERITGLGLGLYIVRQIVEAHGGTICVESELGKGALFIVELPLSPPPPPRRLN